MTEKRFTIENENGEICIIDNITKKYIFAFVCEDIDMEEGMLEECEKCVKFLNQTWEQTLRFEKSNKEYSEENEQLKQKNYKLHKRLGDFEPFEEYIKERTSKTSVNDVIGLVKTDEPTNSVELKKELYK